MKRFLYFKDNEFKELSTYIWPSSIGAIQDYAKDYGFYFEQDDMYNAYVSKTDDFDGKWVEFSLLD